ncbi:alpha/beta hydrolase [Alteromonas sp. 1_MG-2023]|uniref:alpha/beta fold hydrolase n=1 Tax=Alteromonas sp. 1_MG-2023 TaxID=3062669 RepID=UPI0026E1956C|nr:alpha/beta hydrolase [Alteromonas sp. 1_MG-2023]MDO6565511.1 alpha/beta hydrolase [Alteromonas sp. 1_MG-2023]
MKRYFWKLCLFFFLIPISAISSAEAYSKYLDDYKYPFNVLNMSFVSQGQNLSMAYMHLPAQEDKPTVLLLHGKNFAGSYWETTANWLHKQGYGVVIPDQVGFGKSSKPVNYQYSFAALANNTRMLLSLLDLDNVIVTGHSMGGMLASRFALLFPEMTSKLILINPIGLENYLHYVEYKDVEFFYQNELEKTPDNIVSYQKKNYYDGDWNSTYAKHASFLTGWIEGDDWPQLAKVSALTYDMIFTQPVIEEFDDFQMPVTLILGTRDRTGPGRGWKKEGVTRELGRYDKLGAEVKARNSAITVKELSGLGHLPQIEAFSRFTPVYSQALKPDEN